MYRICKKLKKIFEKVEKSEILKKTCTYIILFFGKIISIYVHVFSKFHFFDFFKISHFFFSEKNMYVSRLLPKKFYPYTCMFFSEFEFLVF